MRLSLASSGVGCYKAFSKIFCNWHSVTRWGSGRPALSPLSSEEEYGTAPSSSTEDPVPSDRGI